MKKGRKKKNFNTTRWIAVGFLLVILWGTIMLSLPVSASDGKATNIIDALFTSTTSVCVTGLTTVVTATHWSIFGKSVMLLLIQLGGLGAILYCFAFIPRYGILKGIWYSVFHSVSAFCNNVFDY